MMHYTDFGWTKINPKDKDTWPEDGQKVYYYFEPFDSYHEGSFCSYTDYDNDYTWTGFYGRSGFCDIYDAPYWREHNEG